MPNRDLTYASSGTHGPAERAYVRRAGDAGGAPFAKKTPDMACRGSDLSPQGVDWGRGSNFVLAARVPSALRAAKSDAGENVSRVFKTNFSGFIIDDLYDEIVSIKRNTSTPR